MKRLFIVGCPRSGTTVLQRCLANHPEAVSFPETGFFRQLCGNHAWTRIAQSGFARRSRVLRAFRRLEDKALPHGTAVPYMASSAPIHRVRIAVNEFTRMLDEVAAKNGNSLWVEKTPIHYRTTRVIHKYVPEVTIIHVIRDGRAVLASIRDRATKWPERFNQENSVTWGIKEWNRAIRRCETDLKKTRVHAIIYEDFVSAPEATLQSIARTLDIPYDKKMLSTEGGDTLFHAEEAWKSGALESIQAPENKFDQVFSKKEKIHIEKNLDWKALEKIKKKLQIANY